MIYKFNIPSFTLKTDAPITFVRGSETLDLYFAVSDGEIYIGSKDDLISTNHVPTLANRQARRAILTPYAGYVALNEMNRCRETFDKHDIFHLSCIYGKVTDMFDPDATFTVSDGGTFPSQDIFIDVPSSDYCPSSKISDLFTFQVGERLDIGTMVPTWVGEVPTSINGIPYNINFTMADYGISKLRSEDDWNFIRHSDASDWIIARNNRVCHKLYKIREIDPDEHFPRLIKKVKKDIRSIEECVPEDAKEMVIYTIDHTYDAINLPFGYQPVRRWTDSCQWKPTPYPFNIDKINDIPLDAYRVDAKCLCCRAIRLKIDHRCTKVKVTTKEQSNIVILFLN